MIDMIHNQCLSKQIFHQSLITIIGINQCACHTDCTRLIQCLVVSQASLFMNRTQRKECGTSKLVLFQILNHGFCRILIIGNNILNASAKGCLNGSFVFLLRLHQIGNYSIDTGHTVLLFHDTADTVAISVITLCHIAQGFQSGNIAAVLFLGGLQFLGAADQFLLDLIDACLNPGIFFRQIMDLCCNRIILLLIPFPDGFPLILLSLCRKHTLGELGITDLDLFLHGLKTL